MMCRLFGKTGVPEGIRTPDLRFRKPLLYPAELPGRSAGHYSPKAIRRSRAICLAGLGLIASGLAQAQTCPQPAQEVGRVAKIHPRIEIELADGRLLKPLHLAPFEATPRGATQAARARTSVEAWSRAESISLPARLPLADRWGRILTPIFLRSGENLTLHLVSKGLGRVGPSLTDPCLAPLLAAEIQARTAKLGLWADSHYAVLPATSSASLSGHVGEFVIVEGVVLRLGQTAARFYLDLGPARGSNLSVTFTRQNGKSFAGAGVAPDELPGRTIRVRGILEYRAGPQIEIFTPAAIELIGSKS